MKRVLSFLMAFTLLITSFSHVAYADEATGETTGAVVANAEEGQTVDVNLRMGETVTYTLDGSIDVNDITITDDTIVEVGMTEGECITTPSSVAKLATADHTFNGEEIDLEDCLFTFTVDSEDIYYVSHGTDDDAIYLVHNGTGASNGKPCIQTKASIAVEYNEENGMFTLKSANSYLYFRKNTEQLYYDKGTTINGDMGYYFELFTPSDNIVAESDIYGYEKVTEIEPGKSYLIASKAEDDNYYVLNPVVNAEKYNYVAQVVNYETRNVSKVQTDSGSGWSDAELTASDCLFTFTSNGVDNQYRISAIAVNEVEGKRETVYLNHRGDGAHPTKTNPNALTEVVDYQDGVSLFDQTSGSGTQFLYFARSGTGYYDQGSATNNNTGYCLYIYEPSPNTPDNSPIAGYAKVSDVSKLKNHGKYLIVCKIDETNTDPASYYIMCPYNNGDEVNYLAKVTESVEEESTIGAVDTVISITAVEEGRTDVIVGGVTYQVVVANEEADSITLRKGESLVVSGPLQSEPNDESIISTELINNAVAPYTKVDAIADGYYLIGNANYIIKNSVTSENPSGLAMESANYAAGDYARYIWKVTAVDGGYTIQDINGKYINFGAVVQSKTSERSVVLSTKPQVLTIVQQNDGTLRISYENYKLNNYGSGTRRAAAWNGDDSGNAWNFYAGSADAVKVTSVGTGTATFAANGFNYTVNCNPADYTALNSAIASAKTLVEADYFTKEWRVFESVLGEVEAWVSANSEAKQPEVDAKQEALADATAGLRHLPVYTEPNVNDLAPGAPTGTTVNQPFTDEISTNFRIPAMITLSDGTIIAAADARWDHSGDGCSIDIILSKSTDNGATWEYSFPAFFNDTTNAKNSYGACFIDPVLVRDGNDKIYMMVDLYPGGIAINTAPKTPDAASGFVDIEGEKRLVLYTSNNPDVQDDTNYDYYVGDYTTVYEKKLAPVYEVYGEGSYSEEASYWIDPYFNLYNAEGEALYCLQRGDDTKKVQQNVFFYDSLLHVRCATYLYLITSDNKGETWSEPMLLNSQIRKDTNADIFYGVGPGAGLWIDNGTKDGMVILPAYTHSTERSSFIYSVDGGINWKRSENATTDAWSSESCLIQLDNTTVRHFFRSGSNNLQYTDHTLDENGVWKAGTTVTMNDITRLQNNQVSAIRYSKTIDGKPVIVFSTATTLGNNAWARRNGKIYLFTVDMEADGMPMELVATYDNDPDSEADVYAYSSIAELEDGSIGLLYEYDDTANAYKITYKTISIEEFVPADPNMTNVKFDIPFETPDEQPGDNEINAEVAGVNLILEGNIGVNFHMVLGEEVIAPEKNAYMQFTLGDSALTPIPVADIEPKTVNGIDYYIFKCPVPVKNMGTEIKAQIIVPEDGESAVYTYTVDKYIEYIKNDKTYASATKLLTLVDKMSDFGDLADAYFSKAPVGVIDEVTDDEKTALYEVGRKDSVIPEKETSIYYGSSLLLESNTTLRHYFNENVNVVSVMIGNEPVADVSGYKANSKGSLYYIEHTGIPAHELAEYITVVVRPVKAVDDTQDITLKYSPLTYAHITLSRDGEADNLTSLVRAMYEYQKAAYAYKN